MQALSYKRISHVLRIPNNPECRIESGGWNVFDVRVANVSLITNFRSSFVNEMNKPGSKAGFGFSSRKGVPTMQTRTMFVASLIIPLLLISCSRENQESPLATGTSASEEKQANTPGDPAKVMEDSPPAAGMAPATPPMDPATPPSEPAKSTE